MESLTIQARNIPVTGAADIVVVGGGPGGFAAALKARRMGASVILIEKYDMPGGVHTSGLQGAANPGVGGIHTELMDRFAAAGHIYTVTEKTLPGWAGNPLSHYEKNLEPDAAFVRSSFNPEGAGCIMSDMLAEAGVQTLYGASFVDVVLKDDLIDAVIVENASGAQAIRGKIFIDGTGTSELVARAGAPFVRGGGPQPATADWDGVNRPIPGGCLWIMNGIDFPRLAAYQKEANDPTLSKLMDKARAAGDLPDDLYRPWMSGSGVYGKYYIGHPTIDMSPINGPGTFILWQNVPYEWALHMDDDAEDQAHAKQALRSFIEAEARFLTKYVPGFEDSVIANVGRYVGIRDGRHPIGDYVFTMDDAITGRSFPDAVTRPMTKMFFWEEYRRLTFEIPYRCFLPKKIGNMLLTGASLAFAYETIFMVMRNFPWCTQTGEIAGYAAALCIEQNISPKELDWTAPYF
ncbi:MAG: FAD-dependent oxidoreductase [Rhodospirillales bacterium]|nr:FAD-dependent oxidoreductase [Rhodospirillales bacterium]